MPTRGHDRPPTDTTVRLLAESLAQPVRAMLTTVRRVHESGFMRFSTPEPSKAPILTPQLTQIAQ